MDQPIHLAGGSLCRAARQAILSEVTAHLTQVPANTPPAVAALFTARLTSLSRSLGSPFLSLMIAHWLVSIGRQWLRSPAAGYT